MCKFSGLLPSSQSLKRNQKRVAVSVYKHRDELWRALIGIGTASPGKSKRNCLLPSLPQDSLCATWLSHLHGRATSFLRSRVLWRRLRQALSVYCRPAVVSMLLPRKGVTKIVRNISMDVILNWTSADIQENYYNNLVRWLTLISLAVGRLKQEDCWNFQAILG